MNYFYSLPLALKSLIYSFDPTYHKIYKKIPIELLLKTTLWRVKWLNSQIVVDRYMDEQNKYKVTDFNSTKKSINFIVDYWNKTYPDYYRNELLSLPPAKNCEEEYINDYCEGTIHIMRLLKNLKGWTIREAVIKGNIKAIKEMVLYKPGASYHNHRGNIKIF